MRAVGERIPAGGTGRAAGAHARPRIATISLAWKTAMHKFVHVFGFLMRDFN